MKHSRHHYQNTIRQPMYPNAADPRYFSGKAMEILTAVTSSLGVIAAMVFFVILA